MTYTTRDAVREMNRMDDVTAYPNTAIDEAIAHAKTVIDRQTGTSWGNVNGATYETFTCDIERVAGCPIDLVDDEEFAILFPRTITTATHETDGAIDTTRWVLTRTGRIVDRDTTAPAGYITITGTAGKEDTPNTDIQWIAKTIARQHLINENSQLPERALAQPGEFGNIPLAQPGGPERPTAFPSVNARLKKYRHRGPVVG